jgi:hypothetical protein
LKITQNHSFLKLLVGIFLHGKNSKSSSFFENFHTKCRINLYGKNEQTASTKIEFIQKLREIIPFHGQIFEDESPIFLMSVNKNMFHKVRKF